MNEENIGVVCRSFRTLGSAAGADTPAQLKFMAGPPGGNWFALGGELADLWSKEVMPTTSVTGGAVANIINAHMRKGDLGFSNTSMIAVAQKGTDLGTFKTKSDNAKLLANLYTQYTYFIARKDFAEKNGIKTVDDLVNKKLAFRFATLKTGTDPNSSSRTFSSLDSASTTAKRSKNGAARSSTPPIRAARI